jgi:hypothetical protein
MLKVAKPSAFLSITVTLLPCRNTSGTSEASNENIYRFIAPEGFSPILHDGFYSRRPTEKELNSKADRGSQPRALAHPA